MIKRIDTYIVTDGNGQEAVNFYKNVFDAELVSLKLWDEMVPDCPEDRKHLVLNAQLVFDGLCLQISDENPDYTYQAGKNVVPTLIVDSVEMSKKLYAALSVDAKEIFMELQETFWTPAYANLVDKFGVVWQISAEVAES